MPIPRKDAFGVRQTINTQLSQDEAVWHFRSGWNVAALNCTRPEHQPILDVYAVMLREEASTLADVNRRVEGQFREAAGGNRRAALLNRETHSTSLYNYFANPPARREFCASALAVATDYVATAPTDFAPFALAGLQRYEMAFERFFTAYEEYETASAEWDARYGAEYGPSQPGWVALYGNSLQQQNAGVLQQGLLPEDPVAVPDGDTGAVIPVIPVDEDAVSRPIVQPLPSEEVVVPPPQAGDDEASR